VNADAAPPQVDLGTVLEFHVHPEVIIIGGALLLGYVHALRRWGPIFHPRPDDPPATGKQKVLFVSGVLTYLVAVGWPLHDIADQYLYSAHMVQHVLIGYLAPPLLLLGTPEWLGRALFGRGLAGRVYARLTRPLVAALAFNIAIAFIHWPLVVDTMVRNEAFHIGTHVLLFGTALLAWSSLCSPLPEVRGRLSEPAKMLFIFTMTLLPTIPASFLTFGETPLYPIYAETPNLLGLDARDDMQLAGLIMKSVVGLVLWIIISVMFFRWAGKEGALGPGGYPHRPGGGSSVGPTDLPDPSGDHPVTDPPRPRPSTRWSGTR
jgi:putative membrane protein